MNRNFKVIFNHATGVWQCVSELARAKGKSKSKTVKAAALATAIMASHAWATDYTANTTVSQDLYTVKNDTISGKNVTVEFQDLNIGVDGKLLIKDGATAIANSAVIDHGGDITLESAQGIQIKAKDPKALIIGENAAGTLTLNAAEYAMAQSGHKQDSSLGTLGGVVLGDFNNAHGKLTTNGYVPININGTLIIGEQGHGEVILNDNSRYDVGHARADNVTLGADSTGVGTFILKDSTFVTNELVVGNKGTGVLKLQGTNSDEYLTELDVKQISRGADAKSSSIYIDGGTIGITDDQPNLFAGFDHNDTIEIGNRGVTFETHKIATTTNGEEHLPIYVAINPNAVITGDAGNFRYSLKDDDLFGGFAKYGLGTLEISEKSKQFKGDIAVTQGTLKINGNYTINNGENLVIGLLDWNEDGKVDDDEIGRLVVTGTADIGNGYLKVWADEITEKLITGDNPTGEYKNIVSADKLVGKFKGVSVLLNEDGSTIDTLLTADYSDANKVHLVIKPKAEQPAEPTKPAEPEKPAEEVKPVQPEKPVESKPIEPIKPAEKPAEQPKPAEPEKPVEPTEPAKPAEPKPTEEVKPAEPTKPAEQPTKPAEKPAEPVKPAEQPVEKPTEQPKPAEQPAKPTEKPAEKPAEQPAKPAEPKPAEEVKPAEPVQPEKPVEPTKPNTSFANAANAEQSANPSLAQALDTAIDNGGLLGTTLTLTKHGLSQERLAQGVSELQPLLVGSVNRIIYDTHRDAINALPTDSDRKHTLWAKVLGNQSTLDHRPQGLVGYDNTNKGFIIGGDAAIGKGTLGIAAAYTQSDADTDKHAIYHDVTAKTAQAIVYGDYAVADNTLLHGHIAVARSNVEGERRIQTLTNNRSTTAKSDYDVNTYGAGIGIRHQIGDDSRNITPFARLDYAKVRSDAYRETGAGVYNLDVAKATHERISTTAGVSLKQAITPELAVTATIAGVLENGDKRTDITASFIGSDRQFDTKGHKIGRGAGIANLGVSYDITPKVSISAAYGGEWRSHYDSQGGVIGIKTVF
ncbi:autotransporter domain-containing protein [Moraxella sp. ZJ142]|uniref:autotransporter domain-containing protein n=1 Tax=Moraxella marmotae TaxID=3344520 RepID=UPI0035D4A33B